MFITLNGSFTLTNTTVNPRFVGIGLFQNPPQFKQNLKTFSQQCSRIYIIGIPFGFYWGSQAWAAAWEIGFQHQRQNLASPSDRKRPYPGKLVHFCKGTNKNQNFSSRLNWRYCDLYVNADLELCCQVSGWGGAGVRRKHRHLCFSSRLSVQWASSQIWVSVLRGKGEGSMDMCLGGVPDIPSHTLRDTLPQTETLGDFPPLWIPQRFNWKGIHTRPEFQN